MKVVTGKILGRIHYIITDDLIGWGTKLVVSRSVLESTSTQLVIVVYVQITPSLILEENVNMKEVDILEIQEIDLSTPRKIKFLEVYAQGPE